MRGAALRSVVTAAMLAAGLAGIVSPSADARPDAGARAGADAIAPTAPRSLLVTRTTPSSITLTWVAATDNVAVKRYAAYRNGTRVVFAARRRC